MAKVIGWYKKRPTKGQTRFAGLGAFGCVLSTDEHGLEKRHVDIRATWVDERYEASQEEHLSILLTREQARSLAQQLNEWAELMEK